LNVPCEVPVVLVVADCVVAAVFVVAAVVACEAACVVAGKRSPVVQLSSSQRTLLAAQHCCF